VTINSPDFWRKVRPNRRFAIVCVRIPQARAGEIPAIIRRLFQQPEFRSRRGRCGKIILVATESIRFYERFAGEVHSVAWR
jgi:hypothetical protein